MTLRYASPTGVFIPAATGQVISFIRKRDRFKINEYSQLVKAPKMVAAYRKLGNDQPVRVVTPNAFAWADDQDAPSGTHNQVPSEMVEFTCQRFAYPFRIGDLTVENAASDWKIVATHSDMSVCQAMTCRTKRLIDVLETTGTWGANTSTAATLAGVAGFFDTASSDPGDPQFNFGLKVIHAACNNILLATNGMVQWSDLMWVMSPNFARRFAESSEIHAYLGRSPFALAQVRGDVKSQNGQFGLPDTFANIKIVVEDAVIVTEKPKASGVEAVSPYRNFTKADDTTLIVSRVGGLDGQYGAPSFSTAQVMYYQREMSIEAKEDVWNKATLGRAVEITKEIVPAPVSGWLIQDCLST